MSACASESFAVHAGGLRRAAGGGGWGLIVATNLIARGNDVRKTVGSVNALEFFITLAASLGALVIVISVRNLLAPDVHQRCPQICSGCG